MNTRFGFRMSAKKRLGAGRKDILEKDILDDGVGQDNAHIQNESTCESGLKRIRPRCV